MWDFFIEPLPVRANHVNWQLGHLIGAESFMVSLRWAESASQPPAGFRGSIQSKQTSIRLMIRAQFAKKRFYVSLVSFDFACAATVPNLAKNAKPEDLDKPGPERLQRLAPTVGHTILLAALHTNMHLGQIQVLRRKLGKPGHS